MKYARLILVAVFLCAFAATGWADSADAGKPLTVKTFQFKHKDAEKAAAAIKSLVTANGSVSIQPSSNALVVTDTPEALKAIASAIAQFDVPPQAFRVSIRVISAGKAEGNPKVADELKDVAAKLAILRFNSLENLGSANVDGHENGPGLVDLGNGYRADFKFGDYDPSSDTIRVADFRLLRAQQDQLTPLLKTTLNLRVGQTVILSVTRDAQSQRAVLIVLSAKRL